MELLEIQIVVIQDEISDLETDVDFLIVKNQPGWGILSMEHNPDDNKVQVGSN